MFDVETWSNLGENRPKHFSEKCRLWGGYSFFYFTTCLILVLDITGIIGFYFPNSTPFQVLESSMFGGFGQYGGALAIILNAHGSFTWLVGRLYSKKQDVSFF